MTNDDFIECKFIKEELRFLFFDDFYRNRFIIKKRYNELSDNGKIFYKWFLYSNIHMTEHFKDLIWTYLNFDDIVCEIDLLKAKRIYKVK